MTSTNHLAAALAAGFLSLDRAMETDPQIHLERDEGWTAPCLCGQQPRVEGSDLEGYRVSHSAYGHAVQAPPRDTEEGAVAAWNELVGGGQ